MLVTPQVRAGSLQELVYKNGQAGVTKASVTIVFNNEDKAQSPVGGLHLARGPAAGRAARPNPRAQSIAGLTPAPPF